MKTIGYFMDLPLSAQIGVTVQLVLLAVIIVLIVIRPFKEDMS
jgi:hypothetical protein